MFSRFNLSYPLSRDIRNDAVDFVDRTGRAICNSQVSIQKSRDAVTRTAETVNATLARMNSCTSASEQMEYEEFIRLRIALELRSELERESKHPA